MQKFTGDLSDSYEYAIVWWGQSNSRPWGDRDLEGYIKSPHLKLAQAGQDLTINRIEGYPAGASHGAAGTQSKIIVADPLIANHYVGAEFRLMQAEAQDSQYSTFADGLAKVIGNTTDSLIVQWIAGFRTSNTSAVDWTYSGYVHLQDKWKGYANVRVLTPYQPEVPGGYPAGAPAVPGYTFPATVTGYDSAGVFLPFAWDEGDESLFTATGSIIPGSITANLIGAAFAVDTVGSANFDAATNVITDNGHGLTDGRKVGFLIPAGSGATLPAEIASFNPPVGGEYFVVNATTNTFQIAATIGGTPINFAAFGGSAGNVEILKLPFRENFLVGGNIRVGNSIATITANTGNLVLFSGGWTGGTPSASTYTVSIPHWRSSPYWRLSGFRYPSNDMMPGGTGATGKVYNRATGQYEYSYKITALEAATANKTTINANGLAQSVGPYTTEWAYIAGSAGLGWRLRVKHVGTASTPLTGLVQFEKYLRGKYMVSLLAFQHNSGELNPNGFWRVHSVTAMVPAVVSPPSAAVPSYIDLEAIGFRSYSSPTVTVRSYTPTTWSDAQNSITVGGTRPDVGDVLILIDNGSGVKPTDLSFNQPYYVVSHHGSDEVRLSLTATGSPIDLTTSGTFSNVTVYSPPSLHKGSHNGTVTRVINQLHHRFGAMVEFAWRVANAIGKRVNIIHLGINSSAQIFRNSQNYFGFPGEIGWWDYNKYLDWTPSDPDGNAVRLKKMLEVIAPAALQAEGSAKQLKVLGIVGFQGEGDAIVEAGREMYSKTLNTFYDWLRNVIHDAGLSPYSSPKRIPAVHAGIPKNPWELTGTFYGQTIVGDTEGLVNAAIIDFAAKDGFAATIDTNSSPRLFPDSSQYVQTLIGSDPLHFNGTGEAINGELAADAFVDVANCALPNTDKSKVIEICNLALSHLGESANITSIDPPDGSVQASHCARFYPVARDSLLEMRSWSFASKRKDLVSVTNTLTEWDYAYVLPCDVNTVLSVLPPNASDDYSTTYAPQNAQFYTAPMVAAGQYVPQPYTVEVDEYGYKILYTDQKDAVLRYNALVTDTTKFTPLFTMALSWHLASMLAGPILKGDVGAAEGKRCQAMMAAYLGKAEAQDSQQRNIKPEQVTPWMSGR